VRSLSKHYRNDTENAHEAKYVKYIPIPIVAFNTITPEMKHHTTRNIVRRGEFCTREPSKHRI